MPYENNNTGRNSRKKAPNKFSALFTIVLIITVLVSLLSGCGKKYEVQGDIPVIQGLTYTETVPLKYASQFAIYRYEGGYSYITVEGSEDMLVIPEGGEIPEDIPDGAIVVEQPLERIYLVATSAMALFSSIDGLDTVKFTGSKENDWRIQEAVDALKSGKMLYAGKYSAPDYELLINNDVQLAIESTMIYHTPDVKEKMEELGIKTVVERSSYEAHPLGRTEWVKLYGELIGKSREAEEVFNEQAKKIEGLETDKNTGKTVAFFFINSSGNVVTYKPKGYVPEMIRIAGGEYVPSTMEGEDENALSTVNMGMEEFYALAKDSDFIIYNIGSMGAPISTIDELLDKSPVLEDFKAVQEGNAWCTSRSMFQETDKMGSMISDFSKIFSEENPDEDSLEYVFKLK